MFGFFKKRPRDGSFIVAAVKAALILRTMEHENGGLYTPPDVLRATTNSIAEDMNIEMIGGLPDVTYACVMALLMEQKFIDGLIFRASRGPLGTLTEEDEKAVTRITGDITGVH